MGLRSCREVLSPLLWKQALCPMKTQLIGWPGPLLSGEVSAFPLRSISTPFKPVQSLHAWIATVFFLLRDASKCSSGHLPKIPSQYLTWFQTTVTSVEETMTFLFKLISQSRTGFVFPALLLPKVHVRGFSLLPRSAGASEAPFPPAWETPAHPSKVSAP